MCVVTLANDEGKADDSKIFAAGLFCGNGKGCHLALGQARIRHLSQSETWQHIYLYIGDGMGGGAGKSDAPPTRGWA